MCFYIQVLSFGALPQLRLEVSNKGKWARIKSSQLRHKWVCPSILGYPWTTCSFWCWWCVLGDLIIIPTDSLSISLGMGLYITHKAGFELLGWLWGAIAQWLEQLQMKQKALGSIPCGCLIFSSSSWLPNVDGMKDLWCSSTAWLQYKWGEGSMVH